MIPKQSIRFNVHRVFPLFAIACLLMIVGNLWSAPSSKVTQPTSTSENNSSLSDDSQFQYGLAALRERYKQQRQDLKVQSANLPAEERLRLHKELLEAHRAALAKLEDSARARTQGSRERWEKRKAQRVEKLEAVRKDGSARKHHKDDKRTQIQQP